MRVYIVRAGPAFKVGGSCCPAHRLANIQVYNPEKCVLILDEPGGHRAEGRLRRYFKSRGRHIRGEWFRWDRRVLEQALRVLMTDEGEGTMADSKPSAPTDLGARMAKARVDRGVTQMDLAKRLGVRQAMVSMIEAGEADYGDELGKRIKTFIDSGAGPTERSPRGPYDKGGVSQKRRTTLPQKR